MVKILETIGVVRVDDLSRRRLQIHLDLPTKKNLSPKCRGPEPLRARLKHGIPFRMPSFPPSSFSSVCGPVLVLRRPSIDLRGDVTPVGVFRFHLEQRQQELVIFFCPVAFQRPFILESER